MNFKKMQKALLLIFIVFVIAISPFFYWYLKPAKTINAVIVDKTVPNQNYREHKGIMWVLNNLKYSNNGKAFQYGQDYYGFVPLDHKTYNIRELPDRLGKTDLIYLADTYGVYTDDFYTERISGDRSELIYGGLEDEELAVLKKALNQQNLFIAEFNTLGSPTDQKIRTELENLLGIKWSGWIGRFFTDLSPENEEVPRWLINNYEKQHNTQWSFKGPGFALVSKDDRVVILKQGEDVGKHLNRVIFTDKGLKEFKVKNNVRYYYWFDIIETMGKAEVLAHYRFDLTDKGRKQLQEYGLKETFPAVVRNSSPYRTYYFAGDFADNDEVPSFRKVSGQRFINVMMTFDAAGKQDYFFWHVYYPLIESILSGEMG